MSNYSPPVLRAKLTGLVHTPDIAVCMVLEVRAVVSRLSVSQAVGSAATARARFKSHALFLRQAFLRVSLVGPYPVLWGDSA